MRKDYSYDPIEEGGMIMVHRTCGHLARAGLAVTLALALALPFGPTNRGGVCADRLCGRKDCR
jgi:hypothetical protein